MSWYIPSASPKSCEFILDMPNLLIERLIKAGWSIEKTLFFVIPYFAGGPVNSGIARDYKHKVYYRVFIATEGVLEKLSDKELIVIADHEKDELMLAEDKARKGMSKIVSCMGEGKRHEQLFHKLCEKHGEVMVKKVSEHVYNLICAKNRITRPNLNFWLSIHLMRNYGRYDKYAIRLTQSMLSNDQLDLVRKYWRLAVDQYSKDFPIREYEELLESLNRSFTLSSYH